MCWPVAGPSVRSVADANPLTADLWWVSGQSGHMSVSAGSIVLSDAVQWHDSQYQTPGSFLCKWRAQQRDLPMSTSFGWASQQQRWVGDPFWTLSLPDLDPLNPLDPLDPWDRPWDLLDRVDRVGVRCHRKTEQHLIDHYLVHYLVHLVDWIEIQISGNGKNKSSASVKGTGAKCAMFRRSLAWTVMRNSQMQNYTKITWLHSAVEHTSAKGTINRSIKHKQNQHSSIHQHQKSIVQNKNNMRGISRDKTW